MDPYMESHWGDVYHSLIQSIYKIRAILLVCVLLPLSALDVQAALRAGAAVVDATPPHLPVLVNGGFFSRSADTVRTPIQCGALVLDDGRERVAIVIADSCMMPRSLLDEAKQLAAARTTIRTNRMLIAATHSHSAPSVFACLGTEADAAYVPILRERLAEAIVVADANLEPVQVGWAVADAAEYTATRRWIRRPDRIGEDPFGNPTVRANMHAAANWDDVTGPSGPEDPALSMVALRAQDGRPVAVLANFSMHYFSDEPLSADYYGLFREGFKRRVADEAGGGETAFVALMSHGCSGDIWLRDYEKPVGSRGEDWTIASYTEGLLEKAWAAYATIRYHDDANLAMAETRLPLRYRVPDKQWLEWAQRIVAAMGDRAPKDTTEVYAREQVLLHQWQSTQVVIQALRIGDIAIATTPTETYALTGLKIKFQSPLPRTMVLDLANGGDGYIPPPEQHVLGGYNTWPARSAGLEIDAEPKIAEAALQLLEGVAGRPRRPFKQTCGPAAQAVLEARPIAYWRLDEFARPRAVDASGHHRDAFYESGVVFFLDGPRGDAFCTGGEMNRAAHFAGGRLEARLAGLGDRYSVSLWFWNGMPAEARAMTGWLISRGAVHGSGADGDHLGIGGTAGSPGRLVFASRDQTDGGPIQSGRTEIKRWTWNHAVLVRDGASVRVYLNGNAQPEIETTVGAGSSAASDRLFVGGRCDGHFNWEGRLDEIAVFDRALTAEEIAALTDPYTRSRVAGVGRRMESFDIQRVNASWRP